MKNEMAKNDKKPYIENLSKSNSIAKRMVLIRASEQDLKALGENSRSVGPGFDIDPFREGKTSLNKSEKRYSSQLTSS